MPRVTQPDGLRDCRSAVELGGKLVASGVVEVAAQGDGWYLVSIGRAKSVKCFNITRTEAAELVRILSERVLTLDGPGGGGS